MNNANMMIKDKTVLITGGGGAVGSNLCKYLLEMGVSKIVVLDDFSSSNIENVPKSPKIIVIEGSILSDDSLFYAFSFSPNYVIHLAALFANQKSVENPFLDLEINGLGILKVLQLSNLQKVERFVYSSSRAVYPSLPINNDGFIETESTLELSTPYQITKQLGEMYCNFFYKHYGLQAVKVRIFNSYGPGEAPGIYRNVIPNFIEKCLLGKDIVITGDGQETRDFTYVEDVCSGIVKAMLVPGIAGESFNLCRGQEIKIFDLASMIIKYTNSKSKIIFKDKRDWDGRNSVRGNPTKSQEILGFQAKTNIEEGLRPTIDWLRQWILRHDISR